MILRVQDPEKLWSPYGLRSLSKSDKFYHMENGPGTHWIVCDAQKSQVYKGPGVVMYAYATPMPPTLALMRFMQVTSRTGAGTSGSTSTTWRSVHCTSFRAPPVSHAALEGQRRQRDSGFTSAAGQNEMRLR